MGGPLLRVAAAAMVAAMTAATSAVAAPRGGQRTGKIAVGLFVVRAESPPSPRRMTRLLDLLESGLAGESRIEVVDIDHRLAARAAEIPTERISEARGLLRSGEVLLRKGRAADALVRLETAESHIGRSLSFASKRELAQAQFLVGAANAVLGRTDAATAAFVRLQVWRPNFVADTTLAPAQVLPLWQAAHHRVEQRAGGSIELTSSPSGAHVYVDGSRVGVTPTTVEGLIVGRHYVTFKQAGYQRTVTEVEVSASAERAVSAQLEPSTGYGEVRELVSLIRPSLGAAKADPAIRRLGELLSIEHALFIRLPEQPGEPYQALLYHTRTRARLASATASAEDNSDDLFGELAGTLYAGLVLVPEPVVEAKAKRSKRSLARRWWLWAGIAAAATAVALPLMLSGDDGGSTCPAGSRCGEVILDF